jgi:HPt (histidine-containing phosphotransfer) domain-containing protein
MAPSKPPPEDPDAVFNPEDLLDTFTGDRELARSVLDRFIQRTGEQLRELPALQGREDWEAARREAHLIKGSAGTISAGALSRTAARLETACQYQMALNAGELLPKLEADFARFKERAGAWLRENEKK